MTALYEMPGLVTDTQNPYNLKLLVEYGYEFLSFQHFNPKNPTENARSVKVDYDLAPARAAGFKNVGVWGVTYGTNDVPDSSKFHVDGIGMGQQAVHLGADHLIVDAEMCAKFTKGNRGLKPLIDGIRAGGWSGPVHFNPLGAPANPKTKTNPSGNDFACDTQSFTETGGGVFHQDYVNEALEYRPDLCVAYWEAVGIPVSKQNAMIALYSGKFGKIQGSDWVKMLKDAGIGKNFSVFMAQHGTEGDYVALESLTKKPVPPDTAAINAKIIELCDSWLNTRPGPETSSRLRCIRRIAASGGKWTPSTQFLVVKALNEGSL